MGQTRGGGAIGGYIIGEKREESCRGDIVGSEREGGSPKEG